MPALIMITGTKVIMLTREQHHETTISVFVEGAI